MTYGARDLDTHQTSKVHTCGQTYHNGNKYAQTQTQTQKYVLDIWIIQYSKMLLKIILIEINMSGDSH